MCVIFFLPQYELLVFGLDMGQPQPQAIVKKQASQPAAAASAEPAQAVVSTSPPATPTTPQAQPSAEPQQPVPATTSEAHFTGQWHLTANNYSGLLELNVTGGQWSGRIYYDVTKRWESLSDISVDPTSGKVVFFRPGPQQRYEGMLKKEASGAVSLQGTFNHKGQGSYLWSTGPHTR